jgi:hypothetical protein
MLSGFQTFADIKKPEDKLKPNTVITEENLNDVLEIYGIDSSSVRKVERKENEKGKNRKIMTVEEFEEALIILRQHPKEITINETIDYNNDINDLAITSALASTRSSSSIRLRKVSYPSSNFGIEESVTGYYAGYGGQLSWTGASDPYIGITGISAPGTSYEITDVHYLNCSYTWNTIKVNSEVVITAYIGIDIPNTPYSFDFEVNRFTMASIMTWGLSSIPGY